MVFMSLTMFSIMHSCGAVSDQTNKYNWLMSVEKWVKIMHTNYNKKEPKTEPFSVWFCSMLFQT